jgi:hypothetical protein
LAAHGPAHAKDSLVHLWVFALEAIQIVTLYTEAIQDMFHTMLAHSLQGFIGFFHCFLQLVGAEAPGV